MSEVEINAPRVADSSITARPATDTSRPVDDNRGRAGVAPIKAEYIIQSSGPSVDVDADYDADDAAEGSTSTAQAHVDGRDSKRRKTGEQGGRGDKKKNRGQNKNRGVPQTKEFGPKICRSWELTGSCTREGCRFTHDWTEYFSSKPQDLPKVSMPFLVEEPYVTYLDAEIGGEEGIGRSVDLKTVCPVYVDLGYCPFGWRCRFLGGHVRRVAAGEGTVEGMNRVGEWELISLPGGTEKDGWKNDETNWPNQQVINALRKATYEYPITKRYLEHAEPNKPYTLTRTSKYGNANGHSRPKSSALPSAQPDISTKDVMYDEEAAMNLTGEVDVAAEEDAMNAMNGGVDEVKEEKKKGVIDGQAESLDVPLRPEEKRRLNWENGLYLAPLTTVGNLPFRRLCTELGASITISEMALAQPLIAGQDNEWALCRRHSSEKNFGIQLAGSYPNRMVPAAELIAREIGASDSSGKGVDFVDVNLGCPIDLVFNQGAGSALLDMPGRLGKILVGMNRALGEIKFRMGVATGKPNAHKLVPRYATEWGASALTLHGRSRQQRYSKLADWTYIKQCTSTLRDSLSDAGLPPVPMFGNGDCFSSQQYYEEKEKSGVDGVMIARGALIKPWIFTEVAERREWDISATERLEIIKKYAEYGLTHWGSDHLGLQKTRRFLCEFLSFTHRYIPIGLLERMPPMMNERPPKFRGRNELETLLASEDSRDWVRISEMFLGKQDEGWGWVPKHKSNAYGGEEAQG